nr:M15 family metallopeptidase [Sphingomonas jinjuensis]
MSPSEKIQRGYDTLARAATERAKAEKLSAEALDGQLKVIYAQRDAALATEHKRRSEAHRTPNNDQIGREVTVTEATAIARSIGGRVTSGLRSTETQAQIYADKLAGRHDGPVAKPGTSDHERGQAIDIAYGPGISQDSIKRAFRRQGVVIRQLLDEPAQRVFHVGFGKAGPSASTIAKQEQSAADKRARDAEAYDQLLARANEETLRLKRNQVDGIAEAADLDVAAIEVERQRLDSAVDAGVEQRRWTQAQADAVKIVNATNAALKTTEVRSRERQQLLDRQLQQQRAELDRSASLLQLQADLETTNRGRRAIALRLLENDEALARKRAQRLIDSEDPDDQREGRAQLRQIDAEGPLRRQQLDRQFAGPVGQYQQQLQKNVGDMNQALEGVAANGLQSVEDGLTGVLSGTENVADAFEKMAASILADLARIAAQKLILSVIGAFTGGGGGGFSLGASSGGGDFGAIFSAIGGGRQSSLVDPNPNRTVAEAYRELMKGGARVAYASGGRVEGPGGPREDRVLARLSAGEFVINAAAYQRHPELVEAINAGRLPTFADGGLVGGRRIAWRDIPPADRLQRAGGVSAPVSVSIDARGADMAAVARLAASIAELKATLPATIVSTVQDAQSRMYLAS